MEFWFQITNIFFPNPKQLGLDFFFLRQAEHREHWYYKYTSQGKNSK